ncbi:MAG: short-chain dehydrogenase [Rhodoferax sp.]|nr:short-chain dehydrogenase [Rhodoferax sp.]
MDLQLQGRRVLVTGGSKGIGLAIALSFAREGALPTLVSRSADTLDAATATILAETGVRATALALDMGQPGAEAALLAQAGDFDILVNNAGAIPGGALADIDESRWRQAWELKLFGYINLVRAVLPRMQARGAGVIANIIGMAGAAPRSEYIAGSAANAALMAFTQAVGAASPRSGVRVFGINPSPTRSDRMEAMLRAKATAQFGDADRWMELTTQLPFGRLAEPREIADITAFCCSPLAGYLSGTVINVDGGQMYATPG